MSTTEIYDHREAYEGIRSIASLQERTPQVVLGECPPKFIGLTLQDLGTTMTWEKFLANVDLAELFAFMEQEQAVAAEKGLVMQGQPIPFFPMPLPVGKEYMQSQAMELLVLSNVLDRTERLIRQGQLQEVRDLLLVGLPEFDKRFLLAGIARSPLYANSLTAKRWDTFLPVVSAIEQNRRACEAWLFTEVLGEYIDTLIQSFGIEGSAFHVEELIYNWLLEHYRLHPSAEAGKVPTIAIVVEKALPLKDAELPYLAQRFKAIAQRRGTTNDILFVRPEEMIVQGNKMYARQGKEIVPVDLVWVNSFELQDYEPEVVAAYWEILEHPDVFPVTIDGLSRIGASKCLQSALLHLPWFQKQLGLTLEEIALITKHIPFAVDPAISPQMIINGVQIETSAALLQYKDWFISKPSLASHGDGFVAGMDYTIDEWQDIITNRSSGGYVFQLRIPYPILRIPVLTENGDVVWQDMCADFNIQLVGNQDYSAIARMSPMSRYNKTLETMNVSGGGGVAPIILVEN